LSGNDVIFGAGGNDILVGGSGNDRIEGNQGSDVIIGGSGNDVVDGGTGNDRLDGGLGNDRVVGGTGNDSLLGGIGADTITAGNGSDSCAADSADRVSGACAVDATGPLIQWIRVPRSVKAGLTFSATFSLKDPSSVDTNSPNVKIGGAPGLITSWCGFPILASLDSGTATDGVWSIRCAVPSNAVSGNYSLFVDAQDYFGNPSSLAPIEQGDGAFEVIGGNSDNRAPIITNVDLPSVVARGESVTLSWTASDDTGVAYSVAWIYGPNGAVDSTGKPVVEYSNPLSERVSGTEKEGAFDQTVTMSPTAVSGSYSVWISTADSLGNKSYQSYGSFSVE
jgi:hypothetical protein